MSAAPSFMLLLVTLHGRHPEDALVTIRSQEPISVTDDTDLLSLLDHAAKGRPLLLERDGVRFRLERDDIYYEPDPDQVRRTLAESVGSWADLDTDKMIEEICEARRAGSRPPDRP
jgi:hypothetical protein